MKVSTKMILTDAADAAEMLGVTISTVYRMANRHRIGYVWGHRYSKRFLLVDSDVILALVARHKAKTAPDSLEALAA